MNNPKIMKTIFFHIILAIVISYVTAQSEPATGAESRLLPVGRDNPFAEISRNVRATSRDVDNFSESVEEKPELFMQTVTLKFLNAKSLMVALENMLSVYGTIATGEENNSLIICDTKENLEKILAEIQKADKTPQQIQVEVVIIDVQLSDENEIGINWDILSDEFYDIGYRQNFIGRLGSTPATVETIGNATAFNTTGIGGNFSVISGTIRNVVSMLQQKRNIEILASPRVMVVSGKTASIEAVRELPYNEITNTSEGGQLSSTEFKKVGVKLNVTATLTDNNLILLSVDSEQNVTVGESVTQVPIIDTRNARTELLLENGQVVIIGGLRRREMTKQVDQIPILGDIPLLGLLFKYTNTKVNNTELIVFLSPHIYKDGEPIPEDAMSKFNEITDGSMLLLPKEAEKREYRNQLDQSIKEKTATIELLDQKIAEWEQLKEGLKQYCESLEKSLEDQSDANRQIQEEIAKFKQAESELKKVSQSN